MTLDTDKIRRDFPSLAGDIKGKVPIYFDNACMTLRPQQVINAMNEYYLKHPSCHKRSVHKFGKLTTKAYEKSKTTVQKFINASEPDEIVYTKNATESINIVANSLPFEKGDGILISDLEHNSNFLPWQVVAKKKGLQLKTFSLAEDLTFDIDKFKSQLSEGVKFVSVVHTSHITGYTFPVKEIVRIAHEAGAMVLIDGAQSIAHQHIDVQDIDADFFVFSFHKMLGPAAMGCLHGKKGHLENLPVFLIGGETVEDVSHNSYVLAKVPERFEAGLQNYAGAMGVTAAIEYLNGVGMKRIEQHVTKINAYITNELAGLDKVQLIGPSEPALRAGIVNLVVDDMDSGELSILLDETENIMTRSGVHCCHAGYKRYGLSPSLRVSLYLYNTLEEATLFVDTLKKITKFF